ncbi:hypothetical protein AKJ37_02685 [candidate division MSBL1 archaeon SCGC-AAA259I09]|uniref:CN hydrolase domain-containing protein n=2 Tax=candidate division MSBL1 TaxID=215777 RepID=A0A133UTS0_9EURY|nr:hypothetical protein AKJ62_02090 [candidate division MSBL1 archaeon SCGC-AAA259D14]KXA97595.1 hypothetical protein AKJ37_02685 [candidate division MSBL1 archaeon SCGC-AAA259I09]
MPHQLKIALLQISTGPDKLQNLEKVNNSIDELGTDPDIVVTPEYLMGLQNGEISEEILNKNAETLDSEFVETLRRKAKEMNLSILFTTYRRENGFFNSSVFVDDSGDVLGVYDKIHLFDAFDHEESDFFNWGENIVVFDWKDFKIGLATCFDLRFPELFRIIRFKGADMVLVPSGFYAGPHKAEQWRTLISARAHENNFFVVGVDQPKPYFVGESMVASPLGYEVDRMGKEEGVRTVEIDMQEVEEAWRNMPMEKLLRADYYKKYEPYLYSEK